jgi:hypothetical protein
LELESLKLLPYPIAPRLESMEAVIKERLLAKLADLA